jgi:release factor glutamine methyltransferase
MRAESLSAAIARVALALKAVGIDEATGDARRLVAAAIHGTSADLIRDPARELSSTESDRLNSSVARRSAREPVSRILGFREFYGRPFIVTPAVLDPRPDTETLIDAALDIVRAERWIDRPIRILDIGTGSGAILLTLLAELPCATGTGIDISPDALACAEANARALGLLSRASFVCHDMCDGLPLAGGDSPSQASYDLIVSNPPYIVTADLADLDPEVAVFDPRCALDGGSDGLQFYRSIVGALAGTPSMADKPQWVVLELGIDQHEQVVDIIQEKMSALAIVHVRKHVDLGSVDRCVSFKTRSQMRGENVFELR